MVSPDAFLSPRSRAGWRAAQGAVPSSPDLPSVQQILSQKPPSRPPLKSGSKAAPIPENEATTTFTSAGSLWRSLKVDELAKPSSNQRKRVAKPTAVEDIDTSVSVEYQPKDVPQKRKPRRQKQVAPKRVEAPIEPLNESNPSADNQAWKKLKAPKKNANVAVVKPKPDTKNGSRSEALPDNDKEQARSCYFDSPEPQKSTKVRAAKVVENEPLNLEVAMARRTDWTPPAQRTRIIIDIDSGGPSEVEPPRTLQGDDAASEPFENMLASFKFDEPLQPDTGSNSSCEDSSFLRKRKLLELVPTSVVDAPESAKPDQSPTRRKAPKKKTRTITGIATAAYRPQTQPDQVTASVSDAQGRGAAKPAESKTRKSQPRKRPAKPSKKKQPPPKPILLSPGAALNQVARQDFVFGTWSQLAGEQSPTLLRDPQAAMRASNQLDSMEFTTPLNSDALEPPERQQTLWGAGARDADGDLFDVEVRNFADGSGLPEPASEADPFGYIRCDEEDAICLPELPAVDKARDDGSFVNLSDILPPHRQSEPLEIINDDSHLMRNFADGSGLLEPTSEADPFNYIRCDKEDAICLPELPAVDKARDDGLFVNLSDILPHRQSEPLEIIDDNSHLSGSELPARRQQTFSLAEKPQIPKHAGEGSPVMDALERRPVPPSEPSFELYTDAQLAKEVAQYGFKPIKRRTAMIALLTKCQQERAHPGHGVVGSGFATAMGASRSASTSTVAAAREKRPRGPRKVSTGEEESPKQPPESPRRRQGRPRKDAGSPSVGRLAATSAKETAKDKSPAPVTQKGKAKAPRTVIEIPDSQSDAAGDSSASACSSPDATFSPAQPVDLSFTFDEDTVLALAMSPTDQQASLFTYITKAVTSAARTTDPAQPSWHEKMLMYDPIVLEKLTRWLNCGQLTRVGCDEEASVGQVKQWCESKSILCLWERNLRGEERKCV
ncbi:hypothetical protein G6O67_007461 [Ophiocordyceps sinensis]|uniref:Structure-specific endonuclease subunit SLX4 n=2 Tax=Ophiocordyceps sinensis TaxID=72228 RepID=A0A8H4LV70_9HYPO|nr:hypothetical protein G6O67_007461 [Ophiocordyceps sinensis]